MSHEMIIVFSLIGLFIFSAIEYAFRFFSISKLQKMLERKNSFALSQIERISEQEQQLQYTASFISIFLFGIFLFEIQKSYGQPGILVSLIAILFFGKTLLRTLIRRCAEHLVITFRRIMIPFYLILYPLTTLMVMIDSHLFQPKDSEASETEDSIMSLVSDGEIDGTINESEKDMIEGVFDIHQMQVNDIMVPRTDMHAIDHSVTLDQACRFSVKHGHSRIPVYKEEIDDIIGVLYVKDILKYIHTDNWSQLPLAEVIRQPYFVPEAKKLGEMLEEFRKTRIHIAIILDEYGGTAGMLTIEDILEEIVGEIEDEHDLSEEVPYVMLNENRFDVLGKMHINEINEAIGLELEEEAGYETIAGFIIDRLQHIPVKGESLSEEGISFTILDATDRKINRIRIEKTSLA